MNAKLFLAEPYFDVASLKEQWLQKKTTPKYKGYLGVAKKKGE
jgi:hypothetical protein